MFLTTVRHSLFRPLTRLFAPKRRMTAPALTIGTHNGHFHADEALAVYALRLLPAFRDAKLVRSRDPAVLETCDIVVDVGGEYNHERRRYDHHQRGFTTTFPGRNTKLSSAGLVYLHYGRDIIAQAFRQAADAKVEEADVDVVWNKIYESFVEAVDANDNGIAKYDADALKAAGIEPRYSSSGNTLGALVGRRNPSWNTPTPSDPAEAQAFEDERFLEASAMIGEEFRREVDFFVHGWLPARSIVHTAFAERKQYDEQGRILVLQGQSVPWKEHLYALGTEQESLLYVMYPEKPTPGAKWRIQAVPVEEGSFQSRKALPEAWRATRDAELDAITGVPGGVFVHAAGFIGGHTTYEGALALAKMAVNL